MRAVLLLAVAFSSGCPSEPSANPPRFWIALNGSELRLRLQPIEPNPF